MAIDLKWNCKYVATEQVWTIKLVIIIIELQTIEEEKA